MARPTRKFEDVALEYETRYPDKKLLSYSGVNDPVRILCPIHGEVEVASYRAVKKTVNGCPLCGGEKAGDAIKGILESKRRVAKELEIRAKEMEEEYQRLQEDQQRLLELLGKSKSELDLEGRLNPWDDSTELEDDEREVPFYKTLELAAGHGSFDDQHHDEGRKIRFSARTLRNLGVEASNVICASIRGDSMDPVMPHGTTIGIDISKKKIVNGKIYAINTDGWLRVKRLFVEGDCIRVSSFNPEYNDELIPKDDVVVGGWVFWWSVLG